MEYVKPDESIPVTTLLRRGRDAYGFAIRIRLSAEGLSDLPKSGPYFVGGLANGADTESLLAEMNLTDQEAEKLLDGLLMGKYIEPEEALGTENAMAFRLTTRGLKAARIITDAIGQVNEGLSTLVGPDELAGFRSTLLALLEIQERTENSLR